MPLNTAQSHSVRLRSKMYCRAVQCDQAWRCLWPVWRLELGILAATHLCVRDLDNVLRRRDKRTPPVRQRAVPNPHPADVVQAAHACSVGGQVKRSRHRGEAQQLHVWAPGMEAFLNA